MSKPSLGDSASLSAIKPKVRCRTQPAMCDYPACRCAAKPSQQPGETVTYKARVRGAQVMEAMGGLTPWAQEQVLLWALEQVRGVKS